MKNPDFLFLPFEILSDKRLTLRHVRVLMAIFSWRKSNTNTSRISREVLSKITDYPVNRISNITSELVELGWIKKHGNGGKAQWIRYEIQELKGDCFGKGDRNGNGDRIGMQTVTELVTQTVTESVTPIDTVTNTVTIQREKIDKKVKLTKKNKAIKFIPPTIKEVHDYLVEKKIASFTADQFVDHYQATSWRRGNTKIKDWKACVRTWNKSNQTNTHTHSVSYREFNQ